MALAASAPSDPALPALGPRIRALREGMDLSLRELAVRSGVSAPMLSQVERGETSPTLAVAGKIAGGLDLRLSQLLRLHEGGALTITPAGAAPPTGRGPRAGPPHQGLPAPPPRPPAR